MIKMYNYDVVFIGRGQGCFMWGVGNEVENQAQTSMLKMMNPHFKLVSDVDLSKIEDIQQSRDSRLPSGQADIGYRDVSIFPRTSRYHEELQRRVTWIDVK